ncbi:lactonase family protein [Achromobacter deleyi]|uniref:lactonase family protein n=1 Tax=Achromobacter deleyi TaxID=1353891 RepID=UPI0014932193|nr:lactonase family protein [Achromobacter deleyi]QVQ26495.1 lactonase family protein [Achromobacter deleyi]UIP22067.1 lactonase family protein [Achromobacter deleyi]
MHVYIGSRTTRERNARGDGISVYDYAPDTGSLTLTQVVGGLVNPSYLLPHPSLPVLYAVHGDSQEVSALRRDTRGGSLKPWRMQACEGRNPVHLALGPSARYLMVSNHLTGTLAVLPVAADGALAPVSQTVALTGEPGPHRKEQPHAKPHYNLVDPSGRYVVVPDKGLDRVFLFTLNEQGVGAEPASVAASREGAGPRHAVFHPAGRWLYVVNELDNTVAAYGLETGALRPFQVLPTLPDTCTGNSRAAGIAIDAHGLHLYVSNRGHDSIAVFRVDPVSGRLAPVQHAHTQGRTPRFFTLSPDGRFLFALNEDSDTLLRFRVNPQDGTLVQDGYELRIGSPVCMVFARRQT